jgi:hypothetical protein
MPGGIVSAALSVGSLRPGVTGHPDSVELGLSSLYVVLERDCSSCLDMLSFIYNHNNIFSRSFPAPVSEIPPVIGCLLADRHRVRMGFDNSGMGNSDHPRLTP